VKPEKKLYQKFKKNTPLIQHTRIETYINHGVPDCLCYNDLCGFFMVELKYTTTNKVRFSPHQILWAKQKLNRNFLLLEHAPPRVPSLIKLYESKSIEGLLLDHREVKPLAVNDWPLIQKILINQKNN
tara:strand:- start:167 stop:550 length:384 start_codon:yes stop_codon:yes gene_type:complete